jgi:mannose-1-phosphate guanylyltransferase
MNLHQYVVIMAGGIGTRFWPFSRSNYPKQFHDVLGTGQSLLQQTIARFAPICPTENIFIVTSEEFVDLVKTQLPQLQHSQILAEPTRCNTAPCVAYACYKIASRDPEANIVVAPADHVILRPDIFVERLQLALDTTAQSDVLVTLGIQPHRPDTGYGYIRFEPSEAEVKTVHNFTEKPSLAVAEAFLASGEYVWNAGIFVWRAATIQAAFEAHLPEMAALFSAGQSLYFTAEEPTFVAQAYRQCARISIDVGVMEKASNVRVVLSDFGWSDLGTWKSLYDVSVKDEVNQNVLDGHILTYETRQCIIKTPQERLVVVRGLEGYIVAEYDNVLMICPLKEEQQVKDFVEDAQKINKNFV